MKIDEIGASSQYYGILQL